MHTLTTLVQYSYSSMDYFEKFLYNFQLLLLIRNKTTNNELGNIGGQYKQMTAKLNNDFELVY